MIHYKSFKWGYGLVVAAVVGLSGCFMDDQSTRQQEPQYSQHTMPAEKMSNNHVKKSGKSYASKEPTQKATPGPKRTEAPQLPVIQ